MMKIFQALLVVGAVNFLEIQHVVAQVTAFEADSPASYKACPACPWRVAPIMPAVADSDVAATQSVVGRFIQGLTQRSRDATTAVFCKQATLWGTVSTAHRTGTAQIKSYFEYFAVLDNTLDSICPDVMTLSANTTLANISVRNSGSCMRMAFTIDIANNCIQDLYSSQFPGDPELLQKNDTANDMPWAMPNGTTSEVTVPRTVKGECSSCANGAERNANVPAELLHEMKYVLDAWAGALLQNDPVGVTNTYCESSMLWGTVSNMRRYGKEQIGSYFDWFALSRDFTSPPEGISNMCHQYSVSPDGRIFTDVRVVLLGDQCLRMQFQLVRTGQGNTMCIKTLQSSYFPDEPAALSQVDMANGMPWFSDASKQSFGLILIVSSLALQLLR